MLVIKEVKSSCGCTVPRLARYEFAPGEGDAIEVTFDPFARKDDAEKTITVVSNSATPTLELKIKADVRPLVRVIHKFIKFGELELGRGAKQIVSIQYADPSLELREVSVNHPNIKAEVVESNLPVGGPDGRQLYEARIAVTLTGDGPNVAERPTVERVYSMMVQGTIFGQIEASSSSLNRPRVASSLVSVGQVAPGARFSGSIRLTHRAGRPFQVLGTALQPSEITDVNVTVQPVSESSYDILIEGSPGSHQGPFTGKIIVKTDVPGEEELTLGFMGSTGRAGARAR
jgi:hypothetical protein